MARVGPGLIVLVCFMIAAVEGYDIQAFGIAAPKMIPELGLDAGQQGWAASAAMVGLVIGAFVGGWLADRVGRKPVLVGSVVLFGLFSLATAYSGSYETMLWARLATGLGFGGAMPNLIAIAVEISTPKRRSFTVAAMFVGFPTGGAVAALLARLGGEALDWRTIFLAGGIVPLVLVPAIVRLLPETRPQPPEGADRSSLRALFGRGRALQTLLMWAAFVLTLVVLYLVLNWLPTLVVAKGLPPAEGFAAAMAFNLAGVAGGLAVGWATDRVGYRWPLTIACAAIAASMVGLASAHGPGEILVYSAIAGFMVLGAQYSLYAVAPGVYPPEVRAWGAGAAVAVGRFGSIAGPLIGGELRQAGASPGDVFTAMTPVALTAAAAVLLLSFLSARRPIE